MINATIRNGFAAYLKLRKAYLRVATFFALTSATFAIAPQAACSADLQVTTIGNLQIRPATKTPVFFVTDRKETVDGDKVRYVDGRSPKLSYGISYLDKDKNNKQRTVVFDSAEQFFAELQKYDRGEPICFLHGYHRNFKSSIQLGFETAKGLDRPIVLFSWPTRNSYVKYFVDETNAEWAGPHFAAFLTELGKRVPNQNITILSHSVGAKVMTSAFQTLAINNAAGSELPRFGHILMCSPDIDRDIFSVQAPLVKALGSDVRIYVSTKDKRISVSNFFHGGYRVGSATKLQNIDGIEFVHFESEDNRRFGHSIPYGLLSRVLKGELAASADHAALQSFQPVTP